MPKSKKLISADVLRFLEKNTTAVISTSYKNLPYSSTVYYVVDKKLNFYFFTKRNTDKYLNLAVNSNVSIVVGTGPKQISVQARGNVEILYKNEKEKIFKQLMALLKKNHIQQWPTQDLERFRKNEKDIVLGNYVVFKVIPQQLIFMNLNDQAYKNSLSKEYHTILPK